MEYTHYEYQRLGRPVSQHLTFAKMHQAQTNKSTCLTPTNVYIMYHYWKMTNTTLRQYTKIKCNPMLESVVHSSDYSQWRVSLAGGDTWYRNKTLLNANLHRRNPRSVGKFGECHHWTCQTRRGLTNSIPSIFSNTLLRATAASFWKVDASGTTRKRIADARIWGVCLYLDSESGGFETARFDWAVDEFSGSV